MVFPILLTGMGKLIISTFLDMIAANQVSIYIYMYQDANNLYG